ncbi:MAG: hypothetical protein ACI9MC_002788 [Kiritimatiellia bacterium]|jgi:hypothetical protein
MEPGETRFNQYQVPLTGAIQFGACFGGQDTMSDFDGKGGFYCAPPTPPPLKYSMSVACGSNKTVPVTISVLYGKSGVKLFQLTTGTITHKIGASGMLDWNAASTDPAHSVEAGPIHDAIMTLPVKDGRKLASATLTSRILFELACNAEMGRHPPTSFARLKGWVRDQLEDPTICRPSPGKTLPPSCFEKTPNGGSGVRN